MNEHDIEKATDRTNHHHHILSDKMGLKILIALLILTVVTVAASRVDFGRLNFAIAMLIASAKALCVVLFFMGLKYDNNENRVIFFSSFVFAAFFLVLTAADLFTRGDNKVTGSEFKEALQKITFDRYWEPSEELKAKGAESYKNNCATCHGADGKGDGDAGRGLNPPPRNFHAGEGWKIGRKSSDIVTTLTKGLPPNMPSFDATIPMDIRFALAFHVMSFGPEAPKASEDDLRKLGLKDLSKPDGGLQGKQKKTVPVEFAIDRYVSGN